MEKDSLLFKIRDILLLILMHLKFIEEKRNKK